MPLGVIALPKSLPSGHKRVDIPTSVGGTAATIRRMQALVSHGKRDFRVRKAVSKIIRNCSPKNYRCYAEAIFRFCSQEIKYAYDPVGVELIETPWSIIESRIADCDSIVVVFASMCEQIGLPCKFVTIRTDPRQPKEFTHVFAAVKIPGEGWVCADPTMPNHPFGWCPPEKFPRKEWNASKDSPPEDFGEDMTGLGSLSALKHRCEPPHTAARLAIERYKKTPNAVTRNTAIVWINKFKACLTARTPDPAAPKPYMLKPGSGTIYRVKGTLYRSKMGCPPNTKVTKCFPQGKFRRLCFCEGPGERFVDPRPQKPPPRPADPRRPAAQRPVPRRDRIKLPPGEKRCPPGYEISACTKRFPPTCYCKPISQGSGGLMRGLEYEGSVIPGIRPTQGVIVEKQTEFQLEPSLIITNPEEIELEAMQGGEGPLPNIGPDTEYYTQKKLEDMYPATDVQIRMKAPPAVLSGMGEDKPEKRGVPPGAVGTVVKAALFAGAVLWLIGRKR